MNSRNSFVRTFSVTKAKLLLLLALAVIGFILTDLTAYAGGDVSPTARLLLVKAYRHVIQQDDLLVVGVYSLQSDSIQGICFPIASTPLTTDTSIGVSTASVQDSSRFATSLGSNGSVEVLIEDAFHSETAFLTSAPAGTLNFSSALQYSYQVSAGGRISIAASTRKGTGDWDCYSSQENAYFSLLNVPGNTVQKRGLPFIGAAIVGLYLTPQQFINSAITYGDASTAVLATSPATFKLPNLTTSGLVWETSSSSISDTKTVLSRDLITDLGLVQQNSGGLFGVNSLVSQHLITAQGANIVFTGLPIVSQLSSAITFQSQVEIVNFVFNPMTTAALLQDATAGDSFVIIAETDALRFIPGMTVLITDNTGVIEEVVISSVASSTLFFVPTLLYNYSVLQNARLDYNQGTITDFQTRNDKVAIALRNLGQSIGAGELGGQTLGTTLLVIGYGLGFGAVGGAGIGAIAMAFALIAAGYAGWIPEQFVWFISSIFAILIVYYVLKRFQT